MHVLDGKLLVPGSECVGYLIDFLLLPRSFLFCLIRYADMRSLVHYSLMLFMQATDKS